MDIEYLEHRRAGQRVDTVDSIVYYKPLDNSDSERSRKIELKERIFGEKISQMYKLLDNRGEKHNPDRTFIEGKIDKLAGLVYSFSDLQMQCVEMDGINISASGLRMRVRRSFLMGEKLELFMVFLPKVDLLDCQCEVVRVSPCAGGAGEFYDVGVKFIVLDDEDRHKIIRYVQVIINGGPN
ncbi:MAG: hypothetical protein A2520_03145 [Deltaproteobacteria bacterium RIFOXYD12_FULL_53_23]|nr:MAG: hypothetical protein A2520_03145 [Deltaproteobacteria bacterium RIFOXYD12_FULL_53_23]